LCCIHAPAIYIYIYLCIHDDSDDCMMLMCDRYIGPRRLFVGFYEYDDKNNDMMDDDLT
jgi:hypothetical protein